MKFKIYLQIIKVNRILISSNNHILITLLLLQKHALIIELKIIKRMNFLIIKKNKSLLMIYYNAEAKYRHNQKIIHL